jgi:hypothetical protein
MAVQLKTDVYELGGQPTVAGYKVISATPGFEEDSEVKQNAAGQFNADITYSRRKTLQLEMEAEHGTDVSTLQTAGSVTVSAVLYNIRDYSASKSRGVTTVSLDLIQQAEGLA